MLETASGEDHKVTSIFATNQFAQTYNLTIANNHTFLVGNGQFVVHNMSCDPSKLAANLKRFAKSVPAGGKDNIVFRKLPNGGMAAQSKVPAKNIPGSSAVYEKQIDGSGKTINFTKTTYDQSGNIVHVKNKF